jgi:hypothetical protein
MDAEYSARVLGNVDPMEVKHLVDDEKAEERTHPSYLSLSEKWEYHVQRIQRLQVGEAIIRLMDDSVHKVRTPRLPALTVTAQQMQVVRQGYLDRYFPSGVPGVPPQPVVWTGLPLTRRPRAAT